MEYKNAFSHQYYEVKSLDGTYGLLVHHDDTVEGVRADIDSSNERAMREGYKPQAWLIVKVEQVTYRDKDGVFVGRSRNEYAVERYPEL